MSDEIEIVDMNPQLVIGTRETGKYELIATLLPKLFQYASTKGAQFQGPPVFVCHEKSVEEVKQANEAGNADVEVAVPIAAKIDETDDMKCYELPGGKMAKIVHKGRYEDCEPTYAKLFTWLGEHGKKVVGPTREYYLNSPMDVPEEELLTEIYAPIE